MPTTPEGKLKRKCRNWLRKNNMCFFQVLSTSSGGCPDDLLCYAGTFIGVEYKSDTGQPDARQLVMIDRIKKWGGYACIIRSLDELKDLISDIEHNL